ncbi:MAG TPA: hypothetical protein VGE59_04915 [Patescibacteria group bacterium]
MKVLFVTENGRVSHAGLDGVEINIFEKATDQFQRYPHTVVRTVADRLGFTVQGIEESARVKRENPFQWLDLRYGNGLEILTPSSESGRVVHFWKVAGEMDEDEKLRRGIPVSGRFPASFLQKRPPEGGWVDPYVYLLDPSGLTPVERDLIGLFLPGPCYSGGTRFDGYFQMHIRGVAEVSRRLGFVPQFEGKE